MVAHYRKCVAHWRYMVTGNVWLIGRYVVAHYRRCVAHWRVCGGSLQDICGSTEVCGGSFQEMCDSLEVMWMRRMKTPEAMVPGLYQESLTDSEGNPVEDEKGSQCTGHITFS